MLRRFLGPTIVPPVREASPFVQPDAATAAACPSHHFTHAVHRRTEDLERDHELGPERGTPDRTMQSSVSAGDAWNTD